MKDERGFTLLEILVTIAVIAIISTVIISSAAIAQNSATDGERRSDLKKIQLGLQQYYIDTGHYPICMALDTNISLTNCTGLSVNGVNCNSFRSTPGDCTPNRTYIVDVPHDPFNNGSDIHYCYVGYTQYTTDAQSTSNRCHTTSSNPGLDPMRCQYYKLYSPLSDDPATQINCHEFRADHVRMHYVTDPSGTTGL